MVKRIAGPQGRDPKANRAQHAQKAPAGSPSSAPPPTGGQQSQRLDDQNLAESERYLGALAAATVVYEVFDSEWFIDLLHGTIAPPPERIQGCLEFLSEDDCDERDCLVDWWPVGQIASCFLNVLGARLNDAPFPIRLDPVAALRLIQTIPKDWSARDTLARRVRHECARFMRIEPSSR